MRQHGDLDFGRAAYDRRCWLDAYKSLTIAAEQSTLDAQDLWRLGVSAYMIGREEDWVAALERRYRAQRDSDEGVAAARSAFWIGFYLASRGAAGRAAGWLGRAQRLLDGKAPCAEEGYLLLAAAYEQMFSGAYEAAYASASDAVAIGERFGEADLVAYARHLQGRTLVRQARVGDGLALLDEVMVSVLADELSPLVTGVLYCSVIEACQEVYEPARAGEWTEALARWCETQPSMVANAGQCLVHRAEIARLHGHWDGALEQAQRAAERFALGVDQRACAAAFYQQAEVRRLRGDTAAAEEAYRSVSRLGAEPQPGLGLLRLAQGQAEFAASGVGRALSVTTQPLHRAPLLTAQVEIMLARGENEHARQSATELDEIADRYVCTVLQAMAAQARGALDLADNRPEDSLRSLRRAGTLWRQVEAPYETARVRVLAGSGCRMLGDTDGACWEWEAARTAFTELGAAPDLAHLDTLVRGEPAAAGCGLSPRELEVLRLLATGYTNKAIAGELVLSTKTVDRHVSNIFTKCGVSSRSAATAYAYQQGLV